MANKRFAKKKARRDEKRFVQNKSIKKALKKLVKKADAGQIDQVYRAVDKAARRGVIHRNKASRIKSRLAKKSQ